MSSENIPRWLHNAFEATSLAKKDIALRMLWDELVASRAALTAVLGDAVVMPPDATLVQRCKELLEWSKTGLLNGGSGGSVRDLAAEWECKVGNHHALSVAESSIKDDAMREVIRLAEALAVTRHNCGGEAK
jgi:hypothetical protein